eukprot:TRINITY_DN44825_c0_g1_i1.p1 TRINITY_DN44825_c0_g1~~TRINITY_DN44825_c0_g1_i1.p1  ORF type:complete len:636 (+),score=88.27 TRINITY_DN44825_c0_g1_i1:102-2009(+)
MEVAAVEDAGHAGSDTLLQLAVEIDEFMAPVAALAFGETISIATAAVAACAEDVVAGEPESPAPTVDLTPEIVPRPDIAVADFDKVVASLTDEVLAQHFEDRRCIELIVRTKCCELVEMAHQTFRRYSERRHELDVAHQEERSKHTHELLEWKDRQLRERSKASRLQMAQSFVQRSDEDTQRMLFLLWRGHCGHSSGAQTSRRHPPFEAMASQIVPTLPLAACTPAPPPPHAQLPFASTGQPPAARADSPMLGGRGASPLVARILRSESLPGRRPGSIITPAAFADSYCSTARSRDGSPMQGGLRLSDARGGGEAAVMSPMSMQHRSSDRGYASDRSSITVAGPVSSQGINRRRGGGGHYQALHADSRDASPLVVRRSPSYQSPLAATPSAPEATVLCEPLVRHHPPVDRYASAPSSARRMVSAEATLVTVVPSTSSLPLATAPVIATACSLAAPVSASRSRQTLAQVAATYSDGSTSQRPLARTLSQNSSGSMQLPAAHEQAANAAGSWQPVPISARQLQASPPQRAPQPVARSIGTAPGRQKPAGSYVLPYGAARTPSRDRAAVVLSPGRHLPLQTAPSPSRVLPAEPAGASQGPRSGPPQRAVATSSTMRMVSSPPPFACIVRRPGDQACRS